MVGAGLKFKDSSLTGRLFLSLAGKGSFSTAVSGLGLIERVEVFAVIDRFSTSGVGQLTVAESKT